MFIILIVKGLEYVLKVRVLLNYNSLQLIIASDSYIKIAANRAKIYHFKFAAELLFKGVNSSSTTDDLDIIYINRYDKAIYKSKR
jgi:hypothetical protein